VRHLSSMLSNIVQKTMKVSQNLEFLLQMPSMVWLNAPSTDWVAVSCSLKNQTLPGKACCTNMHVRAVHYARTVPGIYSTYCTIEYVQYSSVPGVPVMNIRVYTVYTVPLHLRGME